MEPTTPISTTSSRSTFQIAILSLDPSVPAESASSDTGRITVGNFTETFHLDLSYWQAEQYEQSWRSSLEYVLQSDAADSCLITSITDPSSSNFIFSWPVYRRGEAIHVQNSLIFLGELSTPFDPDRPWRSVGARETISEDGDRISEWQTTVSAVREFLSLPVIRPK